MKAIFLLAMMPLACESGGIECTTPDVTNAEKDPDGMMIYIANSITYTCIDGYEIGAAGRSSVTLDCLDDGKLSGTLPECIETQSDENKTFIYAISAVCVALVLILVAAIVFAVVMKWKSNKSTLVLPTEGAARTVDNKDE